ncbi:hypothetical protein ECEC96038_1342, partial [Escherichia coli EC96038]
AGEHALMPFH